MPVFVQLCVVFVCLLQTVHASWWYLGIASSYQSTLDDLKHGGGKGNKCSKLDFLAPKQRELCSIEDRLLDVISKGASMGIKECQHQFERRRWNCSTFNTTNVFGKVLSLKSRETAYLYAIFSAGIMYSVTRACSKGELDHCGCDVKVRHTDTMGEFEWGGCSDNVRYGSKFSTEFVDSNEEESEACSVMNLWNNKAGRKPPNGCFEADIPSRNREDSCGDLSRSHCYLLFRVAPDQTAVKGNIELVCKCHGVSGSCSVKICWRKMKAFRSTGSYLKDKFDGASLMKISKKHMKLKPISKNQKRPSKKDLVYLEKSPDFCEYNPEYGSLGTRNRECNKTSYGLDGCTLMCCGRGYYTIEKQISEDCDCKFYWCCRVECRKCTHTVEMHYCN